MRCDNDGSLVSPVSALERAQRVVGLWYRLANDWLLTQGRTVDQHYLEGRHQPPTPQSTTPSRQLRFIPKNKFITMKLVSILLAKLTVKAFKTRPEVSSSATTPGLTPGKEVKKNSVENKAFLLRHVARPFYPIPTASRCIHWGKTQFLVQRIPEKLDFFGVCFSIWGLWTALWPLLVCASIASK